jgi:hypothetical protein
VFLDDLDEGDGGLLAKVRRPKCRLLVAWRAAARATRAAAGRQVIVVDGKTLRDSGTTATTTASDQETSIGLSRTDVDGKTNDLPPPPCIRPARIRRAGSGRPRTRRLITFGVVVVTVDDGGHEACVPAALT